MHNRLEQHPRLLRLLAHDLTQDEYRRLLARLYGYYEPLEARLAGHEAALPLPLAPRRKTPLLRTDLRALGLPEAKLEQVPRCTALPALPSAEAAMGCLYVIEGATLGGAIIRRHLARSLRVTPGAGGTFYASYEDATGPMWKAFCHTLNAHVPASGRRHDAVVEAACETFNTFYQWIAA